MKKLLVLAAVGMGMLLVGRPSVAKADWNSGSVLTVGFGYGGCNYGYVPPGPVYVAPAYPPPVYIAPPYGRFGVYGGRRGYWGGHYHGRYRGRWGGPRYRYGF